MSWDLERKTTIPGWDFGGYAWTFAKSRSSVINTDLPRGNARRALNRQHQKVSRRRPYLLRSLPREGSARILLEGFRRF